MQIAASTAATPTAAVPSSLPVTTTSNGATPQQDKFEPAGAPDPPNWQHRLVASVYTCRNRASQVLNYVEKACTYVGTPALIVAAGHDALCTGAGVVGFLEAMAFHAAAPAQMCSASWLVSWPLLAAVGTAVVAVGGALGVGLVEGWCKGDARESRERYQTDKARAEEQMHQEKLAKVQQDYQAALAALNAPKP